MGTKWEVYAWRSYTTDRNERGYDYRDELVYQGFWAPAALWAAIKAKRTAGCVKIEWR